MVDGFQQFALRGFQLCLNTQFSALHLRSCYKWLRINFITRGTDRNIPRASASNFQRSSDAVFSRPTIDFIVAEGVLGSCSCGTAAAAAAAASAARSVSATYSEQNKSEYKL